MADCPPQDDAANLADDFSHFNIFEHTMDDIDSPHFYGDEAAATFPVSDTTEYLDAQAASSSQYNTYQYTDETAPHDYPPTTDPETDSDPDDVPEIDPNKPLVCNFVDRKTGKRCKNTTPFERVCDLRKHQKNHRKPNKCQYRPAGCRRRFAEMKELKRHHNTCRFAPARTAAETQGKTKVEPCHCGYDGNGRADNIKRHKKNKGH